jgi:methionine synthase I (cobalamin-dependent)
MICIETMTDVAEAKLAIEAVRTLDSGIPVMATMTFGHTRKASTFMGSSVKTAEEMEKAGASIVGSNCGDGMDHMVGIAREFRKCAGAIRKWGCPSLRDGPRLSETPGFYAGKAQNC